MRISEVSARSGVPATTLRYYESVGLLAPQRMDNGYRVFDEQALERLAFIDAAKELGLELPGIKDLLELADTGTCTKVKAALHPLLTEQLGQVEDSLAKLNRLHEHLNAASRHVMACPDSPQRCRSECAFLVLSDSPGQRWIDDGGRARRRSHWQDILRHCPVSHDGDSLVVEVPVERLLEVSDAMGVGGVRVLWAGAPRMQSTWITLTGRGRGADMHRRPRCSPSVQVWDWMSMPAV